MTKEVIWITGASQGIGKSMSIYFAKLGSTLILTARNIKKLEKVKDICYKHGAKNVLIFPMDLSQKNKIIQ